MTLGEKCWSEADRVAVQPCLRLVEVRYMHVCLNLLCPLVWIVIGYFFQCCASRIVALAVDHMGVELSLEF